MSSDGGDHRHREGDDTDMTEPVHADPLQNQLSSFAASELSAFINELLQQTQSAMEALLSHLSEIDATSVEVTEDVKSCKESVIDRKARLDEDKDRFQEAACRVLDMLSKAAAPLSQMPAIEAPPPETELE